MAPPIASCLLVVCALLHVHKSKGSNHNSWLAAAFAPSRHGQRSLLIDNSYEMNSKFSELPIWNLPTHQKGQFTRINGLRRKRITHRKALDDENNSEETSSNNKTRIRRRVKERAKGMQRALASTAPMPRAIASILRDASFAAVEQVDEVIHKNLGKNQKQALEESKEMMLSLIDEAFLPVETSLDDMEKSLVKARKALKLAKSQSYEAIEVIQVAAIAQAEGAAEAVAQAGKVAERQVLAEIYSNAVPDVNVSQLSFDAVDYESSEMAPPFLDMDSCLVPGKPVVRVEKSPENSRRIFAGIDILASVDDVWAVSFFHQ